jgi:hypothetical protein
MMSKADLLKLLDQVYSSLHAKLAEAHLEHLHQLKTEYDSWVPVEGKNATRCAWNVWPSKSSGSESANYFRNSEKRSTFSKFLVREPGHNPHPSYTIIEDFETKVIAAAREFAALVLQGYVLKLQRKLDEVWKSKELTKAELSGGLNYQWLKFEFADGSRFLVHNDVVHKFSSRGRPFAQFPTTFHDVVLADGTRMKNPSEAKMKKEFAL